MDDDRATALLHLLALAQGREVDARRREYDARPGETGGIEAYLEARSWSGRKRYLVDFLHSRHQTRKLP